jgi:hypothetical protein
MNGEMEKLIGTWESDPRDTPGMESYGKATLEFGGDGSLVYTVHERDRDQVMVLTFRVDEPGFIVTDQPSAPRPEKTEYKITSDGKLELAFGGEKSRYVRISR